MNKEIFTNGIPVSEKQTKNEANVVKDLVLALDKENIDMLLEYKVSSSRADIVIVKDNMVKCCIEVKKAKRTELTKARQYKKYNKLPIPTIYCLGKENIENTVNTIKEKMLGDQVKLEIIVHN